MKNYGEVRDTTTKTHPDMVIATNTKGYSYTKCCKAPLLLKGTSMGLFCSKCKKEIFSYIVHQKPLPTPPQQ